MIEPKTEKHITGDNIPVTTVKPFEVVIPVYNEEKQFLGLGEITVCGAITPKRLIAISSIQDLPEKL